MNRRIAVVGAGIMGLSSSLHLATSLRLDGVPATVEVFAETFSPQNTSDGAAGLWHPLPDSGRETDWAFATYDWLRFLMRKPIHGLIGISEFSGFRLVSQDLGQEDPIWKDRIPGFSFLTRNEIEKRGFPSDAAGFVYMAMMIQGNRYCQWLLDCVKRLGIKIHKQKVESFSQFVGQFDVVINCSGLGAISLCSDKEVEPVRGQVIKMEAPWIKQFIIYNGKHQKKGYIVPCVDYVVIGSTLQPGNWDRTVNPDDRKMILDMCYELEPSLKKARIVDEWVGLRPGRRSGTRVEIEAVSYKNGSIQVVHNYGHGSKGLTFHWGCAQEATRLAYQALGIVARQKLADQIYGLIEFQSKM